MRHAARNRADLLPVAASEAVTPPRTGGPSLDTALYNCHCGYVFHAPVSTSVGCPHCGGTQAW
jgi:hypothetical protein